MKSLRSPRRSRCIDRHTLPSRGGYIRSLSALLFTLTLTAACQDGPPTAPLLAPEGPLDAISDAAHGGGNPHFYFKPPMVPSTTYGGTFDATLAPTVIICEWDGEGCVGNPLATFSAESGKGSEVVRVEPGDEQYVVNWHTGRYPVADGKTYRIRVLVADYELGYADVDLHTSQKEAKNINTGEFIALKDGRTLPIKFRIEEGALPSGAERPMAAGTYHSCGIAEGGAAYCWGQNWYGQLGNGTTTASSNPVAVSGGYTFTQIATGWQSTCALDASGAAYCWGYNRSGTLGRGTNTYMETVPAPVTGGHTFTQLTMGFDHACGLKSDGSVWCWGYGPYGSLGTGNGTSSASPVQTLGGPYQQIDAGYLSTCGVTTAGVAKCWGWNAYRNLGSNAGTSTATPTDVEGGHTFSQVHVNMFAGCGIRTDGASLCWGADYYGTLGDGTPTSAVSGPGVVTGGHAFKQIDVGAFHVCGVTVGGTAHCWGLNNTGQLGIGSTVSWTGTPTAVAGTEKWAFLSTGWSTTCGVTTTGAGKCWGWNGYGQGGTGTNTWGLLSPADIAGGLTFGT